MWLIRYQAQRQIHISVTYWRNLRIGKEPKQSKHEINSNSTKLNTQQNSLTILK